MNSVRRLLPVPMFRFGKCGNLRFRGLLLAGLICYADAVYAISTMRCGYNIVELGDDKDRVLTICGEPERISYRTKVVGSTLHHPRRTLDVYEYEEIQVEEWVYNFGRNRIKELLRFENGILVEINDLGRGR